MSQNWPTASAGEALELDHTKLGLDQLIKVIDVAVTNKDGASDVAVSQLSPSTYFHLHSTKVEVAVKAPPELLVYFGDTSTPNPEYQYYSEALEKLKRSAPAFEMTTLLLPTFGILHRSTSNPDAGTTISIPKISSKRSPFIHLNLPYDWAPNSGHKEWLPVSKAWDMQHWLHAILALDPDEERSRRGGYRDSKKRVCLRSGIQAGWVPSESHTDMTVLFDPLPDIGHDLLGLILHSLIPSPTRASFSSESEAHAASLRDFYACLRPAPHPVSSMPTQRYQPKEMVSQLLPFQKRTVRLLLERELAQGYARDLPVEPRDPDGFWEIYDWGAHFGKVAFRRVTGALVLLGNSEGVNPPIDNGKGKERAREYSPEHNDLSKISEADRYQLPTLLDLSKVNGTMLCEEMGLGKTVEAIAVIALNRHPLSVPNCVLPKTEGPIAETFSARQEIPQRAPVPVIDLLRGPPGLENPLVKDWLDRERSAFEGRQVWDAEAKIEVTEVATTLIVTPPSLLKQWVAEIQRHTPSLRVCVYDGWKSLQKGVEKQRSIRQKELQQAQKKRKISAFRTRVIDREEEDSLLEITQKQFVEYARAHNVVITTYNDLSQDLKFAFPPPVRSRRANVNYKENDRPRSPLVMVKWWRVIMDEVQLHGDQTDAANMVSLIPRQHSLAVSGTPAKTDIKDLMGSLRFLRVPVLPYDGRLWYRLQQPSMRPAFEGIFRNLAVRTTKKQVSGEFNLPPQSRSIVPIELSEIEMHYYNDTLQRSRERLHLTDNLHDRPEDWVLDRQLFQVILRTLRQVCTHIQVGQLQGNGRGDQRERLVLGRQLLTMSEALEKMREDHLQATLADARQQMRMMIRQAQLMVMDDTNDLRHLQALALYERARDSGEKHLSIVQEHLEHLLAGREDPDDSEEEETFHPERPDRNQSQQEKLKVQAIVTAKATIRDVRIILHQSWFFEGDVRHVRQEEDKEINAYAQADNIRKDILARPLKTANMSIDFLKSSLARYSAVGSLQELQTTDTSRKGGIMSNESIDQANDLLSIMNENASLVFEWRTKILQLLSFPIDAEAKDLPEGQGQEVDDPDREYYAEALRAQGQVEAFLAAYAAAVADRREFLLESRSLLASHDARMTKQRGTKAAAQAFDTLDMPDIPDDIKEEAAALMAERQALRDARVDFGCDRPLKAIMIELNGIANGHHNQHEVRIAKDMAAMLRAYISKQSEITDKLNKELDAFRSTFNRRVLYFASLQEISDSVTAPEFRDLGRAIAAAQKEVHELEVKLARMAVSGRYLQYLGTKQLEEGDVKEDCIICFGSSDDTQAVLLQCGHHFCLSCFTEYRKTSGGRKCPSCRVQIVSGKEIQRVNLAPSVRQSNAVGGGRSRTPVGDELVQPLVHAVAEPSDMLQDDDLSPDEQERTRRAADLGKLRMMEIDERRSIMMLDMMGEYGSKINFLIKNLLFHKSKDPSTRHVIFSNWSDSMRIVMQALQANDIKFVSFDQGKNQKDVVDQFVKDESITVFLLHAERESAGLTLTSCRVVHLLEPVLRHSFELQAIGRVDRLGQDKETAVYCYATMDTVESRILSHGVRNSTSIYLADKHADDIVAQMPNVASAAHKGGDVVGGNEEDLLSLIL